MHPKVARTGRERRSEFAVTRWRWFFAARTAGKTSSPEMASAGGLLVHRRMRLGLGAAVHADDIQRFFSATVGSHGDQSASALEFTFIIAGFVFGNAQADE